MPNVTTTTAAQSNNGKSEIACIREKLSMHGYDGFPRVLKLETLKDILDAVIWEEWKDTVTAQSSERRRASHELTRIVKTSGADMEDATEKLLEAFDMFSTDKFCSSLETVPVDKLPDMISAFRRSITA